MKVLQAPTEIAGQMGIISRALNRQGIETAAYNTFHSYLGYRDYLHNVHPSELAWMMRDIIRYFNLFHFHYGNTLTDDYSDLPKIDSLGKPMLMHHWGNDVRTHEVASAKNKYVYTGDSPPPAVVEERLVHLSHYIEHAVVQDYEVYPYVAPYYRYVHVLPIALDVTSIVPIYPSPEADNPLIVHAPTNPLFKGTEHVETAVEALRKDGLKFRYRRIEKLPNQEAVRLYKEADIVVDQVLCGSYGLLAVESMSLGKPVVGFIRPDLAGAFPERPPIVSANPETLFETLRHLLRHPETRLRRGRRGRKYARKYHAVENVVQQLLTLYQTLAHE